MVCRTDEEKILWKDEKTTSEWKSKNLEDIISRMKGWQLIPSGGLTIIKLKTAFFI